MMTKDDYVVLVLYILGIFVVGAIFSRRIKSSTDMFAAGNQSPWWVAGLSSFMTMFSAGTFVVWGSIAYKHGLVAIVINLMYGFAALLAGWLVAGRWRRLGVTSAAEFLDIRFGRPAVVFCTLANMLYKLTTVGVALFSISVIVAALVPLPLDHLLAGAGEQKLGVPWAIIGLGIVVVGYTIIGGLWAVLMTDVLQFIVLMASVAFVVPLMLANYGGLTDTANNLPEGFLQLTSSEWTWWVLAGWCATQFFIIGAEWAFVQRYLCVSTERDARLGAWLFGLLYLVSPVLWMLPPMLYRSVDATAEPSEAYILACQSVLPHGMTGLMVAAMFSATASMVDSQLNVFAGVLTGLYQKRFDVNASDSRLVAIGRVFTAILGVFVILLALLIPSLGGATHVVITVTAMLVGPLLLPTLWGLFSRRVTSSCIWGTVTISFMCAAALKLELIDHVLSQVTEHQSAADCVAATLSVAKEGATRIIELSIGVVLPIIVLAVFEIAGRTTSPGWLRVQRHMQQASAHVAETTGSPLPAQTVGWSTGICGALFVTMAIVSTSDRGILLGFGGVLSIVGLTICLTSRRIWKQRAKKNMSESHYAKMPS